MKLNERKEMHAIGAYIIIKPMAYNPYINKLDKSGIILTGGSEYAFSQETGEMERQEQRIKYGIVMEAGDTCKYFQVGDEVIFDTHSARPVPVLDLGLVSLPEVAAICKITGEGDPFEDALKAEQEYEAELKAEAARRQARESIITPVAKGERIIYDPSVGGTTKKLLY